MEAGWSQALDPPADSVSSSPNLIHAFLPRQAATNTYRLCVQLAKPASARANRFLSLPSSFFESPLPPTIGYCERGLNFCFIWKLELATDLLPDLERLSLQTRHAFGQGPITIEDRAPSSSSMAQCPGGIEGGAGVFSGESEEPQYIPFLGSRTEITSGVIHILRDFSPPTRRSDAGDYREDVSQEGGCRDGERVTVMRYKTDAMDTAATVGAVYRFLDRSVVLILAIPCLFSPSDLLHFVGPKYTEKRVERIRLLRDAAPNRYISLIKFDGAQSAEEFIAEKHGKCFSPLEPEICLAVLVSSVEISTRAPVLEPLFEESEFAEEAPSSSLHSSEFIQIPTCPVCLERIDSSATGIVIIVCNHKFHCQCLSRWGDSSCPVCRFALNKSEVPSCAVCACPTDIWVCLICGHTGCGRYQAGHAADHFLATGHNFALELDSHRVWDYVGDKYPPVLLWMQLMGR